ncbi:hypothetical protein SAMN05421788_103470 [Filimonas lacunae]|uniref:Uncharacterized protein n=1 Tax=Filimonas lacunae TaxID=477680 RepID=A0A1N7PGV4_9BACT|nr:hypothetical protein [Filimonas lacunae]SIT09776.1 hypothetical protein SAMN05421788_103470 [Filimonas lacunae]
MKQFLIKIFIPGLLTLIGTIFYFGLKKGNDDRLNLLFCVGFLIYLAIGIVIFLLTFFCAKLLELDSKATNLFTSLVIILFTCFWYLIFYRGDFGVTCFLFILIHLIILWGERKRGNG